MFLLTRYFGRFEMVAQLFALHVTGEGARFFRVIGDAVTGFKSCLFGVGVRDITICGFSSRVNMTHI